MMMALNHVWGVMMNRRIYDPRRWHKRSSSSGIHVSGQPPAGWVLIWAGRFKRWRRRWFVAHPPGLLLHYKNSDQIGRPGCISLLVSIPIPSPFLPSFPCFSFSVQFLLGFWCEFHLSDCLNSFWLSCYTSAAAAGHHEQQGASIVPATSKERQFKIIKGSIVYYLRTINRDYRQVGKLSWGIIGDSSLFFREHHWLSNDDDITDSMTTSHDCDLQNLSLLILGEVKSVK